MKRLAFVLLFASVAFMTLSCQGRRRIVIDTSDANATADTALDTPVEFADAYDTAPAVLADADGDADADDGDSNDGSADAAAPSADAAAPSADAAAPSADDLLDENSERARVVGDRADFVSKALVEKGRQALADGNVEEARRLFAEAIDYDPSNKEAKDEWRRISDDRASSVGDYMETSRSVADVRRDQASAEVRNYIERGRTLEAREQYEEAVKEYRRALSIISWYDETADFGTSGGALRDMIDTATYKSEVGTRRAREEQIAGAQRERERELAGEREARIGRIRAWFEGAHRAFSRQEYALAREYSKQIQRHDPQNNDAQRIIDMSYDAEHLNNQETSRRQFDDQWKTIMQDMERAIVPQVDTVVFPDNWLDEIAQRKPRIVGEETPEEDAASIAGILSVIDQKRVKGLDWEEQNLDQVLSYLRTITGLNFYLSPKARQEKFDDVAISAQLDDVSVRTILESVVTEPYELKWEPRGGVIWILTGDEVSGSMRLRYFDVKDLAVAIRHFVGEPINLVPSNFTPPEPPELPEPAPIFPAENLVELIRETVGGEGKWEEPASIEPRNNILIVRNTSEILAGVEDLLSQLRANTGLLVNLEIRFMTAEDNFLRDVGVDIRGLGDNSAGIGAPGLGTGNVQDDVFAGTTASPSGVPFGTNAEPSSVGTSRDTGIFYNDGADGAYATRVENLFDEAVRQFGDPEVLTRSGGLSFQHTFLDDTQLEVILRAVEKSERIQEITAPRITVYNTQRANVSMLNQVSYVQDYEVEIAQASNIANPVIQTIQDGIVLDVRPVVSADRRFVQLELRPTVAVLQRPIPTFSTSLAAGPISANAPVILQIPELQVSRVRTTVNMPDEGTLLLGGLKFYVKDNRESGMPFFNNIPILSFLLTRKGTYVNRRNLLILITARIVPLEELEPRDNLDVPEMPEREWIPVSEGEIEGPVAAPGCPQGPAPSGLKPVGRGY
ncbi:MAG: hypothetical protein O2894_04205 [Planctomycetota bacterium]|nr:hypothetical protein [Planctomycetota bacterium]